MRADLILKSNNIFTSTSDKPISGGVAIKGNKILAVGEDFEAFLGPETEVREYGDKLIMPGFIDAHVHYVLLPVNMFAASLSHLPRRLSAQQ